MRGLLSKKSLAVSPTWLKDSGSLAKLGSVGSAPLWIVTYLKQNQALVLMEVVTLLTYSFSLDGSLLGLSNFLALQGRLVLIYLTY